MITAIVVSLSVYLLLLLLIGFRAGRRVHKNPESFFVADRQLTWLQEGLSIFSTAVPGAALLGAVGQFYGLGASFLGYAFGYALFAPVLYWLIGSRFRRIGAANHYQTQSDFLQDFFGSRVLGWIASAMGLSLLIPYFAINPIAVGQTMQNYTGLPYTIGVIIFMVLALSYALYGGLRAVADTDVYHGILLLLFFVVLIIGVVSVAGGLGDVFGPQNNDNLSIANPALGVAIFLPWLVQIGFTVVVAPDRSLRMFSARDDLNLRRGVILMASSLAFASAVYFITALALHLLISGSVENTDTAVLIGINERLPWLVPFFVVGIWGSSLAVASMQMLTIANLFVKDVLAPFDAWRARRASSAERGSSVEEQRQVMTARTVTIGRIVMLTAAFFSFIIAAGQPIFIFAIVGTVFGFWTQLGVVFLFGLFWRRTTKIGALSGLIVGLVLTATWTWVLPRPFGITAPGSLEALFTAAVIVVVSLLTYGRVDENTEHRERLRAIGEGRKDIAEGAHSK